MPPDTPGVAGFKVEVIFTRPQAAEVKVTVVHIPVCTAVTRSPVMGGGPSPHEYP